MGLRPTQGDENRVEEGSVGNYTFLCHLDRSEAEWRDSAVSHIWRKERARYGAPSIGGLVSIFETGVGCPILA